ncbi:MAG: NAD(P)(+) transhydrogenase (Re/Si-specific) subunit beta [SAR324 cluster bacterium]|nr:NAD(P)(+) transhydrogenase (Re/Si-specific) subunit beta [SAR324 cluster bacterium]
MSAFAANLIDLKDWIYLIAAICFIVGIKMLTSPETAAKGNYISAFAMLLAVGITIISGQISDFTWIAAGIAAGALVGIVASRLVKMTAMPQMVALYNGLGGAASALVASSEYMRKLDELTPFLSTVILLSLFVGSLTFTGSVVAFAKLQELVSGKPVVFPLQHLINLTLIVGTLAIGVFLVAVEPVNIPWFIAVSGIAMVLGVLVVIPIGGADMPVVIALLNSYSGIAVSLTGFVLSNNALIIVGSLVGASGIFLTNEMCVAMNRSIWNVLFGGFGQGAATGAAAVQDPTGAVKPYTIGDAVNVLEASQRVILVPGYGMAASQAQHAVRDLGDNLEEMGIDVKYAIHPVAGRMPGHMNVLLAESNVPYDLLKDMDEINPEFRQTDVAIVIGANDVVNPAAHEDPSSPIYGMPILNVEEAKTVMVLKRSMNPGFAGIDNALFLRDNTMMLFGDAKSTLNKLVEGVKGK